MQPRLTVAIVVLQAEGLVSSSSGCVGFALQFAPTVIIPKPGYRLYRSFHAECRFGRSGSSGLVGGLLLLGMGSSESWVNEGLGFQTTYVWFMRVLPKMVGLG